RALDSGRTAGGGAHRRRRRVADLLLHRPAHAQAGAGDAGDLLVHGRLERLHVAADRADRPGALHLAGGAGHAVTRTHHGRGDDDGRRRGHRAAGAGAFPAAAALLHPGTAAGQRQGIGGTMGLGGLDRGIAGGDAPAAFADAACLLWAKPHAPWAARSSHPGWVHGVFCPRGPGRVPGVLRAASVALLLFAAATPVAMAAPRLLDGFEDPAPWRVVVSDQVSASIRKVDGAQGGALCLDYDFNGVSGYAGIQRDLPLEYPQNYRFAFQLRGDSPANDLQFKLVDASGDNVWWVNRPRYEFPREWTAVRYRTRHIDKAWGPDPDRVLRRSAKLEFTIYNNAGGRGSVCFGSLSLEPLPPEPATPPAVVAADAGPGDPSTALAIDGNADTDWAGKGDHRLVLDLGQAREFGGLVLRWADARRRPARYRVELDEGDGRWRTVREVSQGAGTTDWLALPEAEARRIALQLHGDGYALAEAQVQPLAFSLHPNDVIKAMARDLPRGRLPRGFSGEQPYWTIVGVDGGTQQGLIGEDGAVEVGRGGFSIEPFVLDGGRVLTWADVQASQHLPGGGLPLPEVRWTLPGVGGGLLQVQAFADGQAGDSRLVARYRLVNPHPEPRELTL